MELLGGEGQTMSQLKGTVHFMPPGATLGGAGVVMPLVTGPCAGQLWHLQQLSRGA